MNLENNYTPQGKNIQEVRVNADELAASFPESTRFDKTPSELLNLSHHQQNSFTNSGAETAFYPIGNTPTLEPITDSITGKEIREQEELRINQNMQGLANMKLRAEVPYFKQQELEEYTDDLKSALHQREEHLKQMGTSYRNLQRSFNHRLKENDNRLAILESKNQSKATIIKILCPLLAVMTILPFFISSKQEPAKINSQPIAQDYQKVIYTPLPPQPKEKIIYVVKAKDTLSSISQKFYGDSKYGGTILKTNNLSNKKLKPGTKLLISELEE